MKDYFVLVGLLCAVYFVLRWLLWMELEPAPPTVKSAPGKPVDSPGKGIDASALCDRLQHVRRDYHAELPSGTESFKRQLRVESKRAEVAAQAYFQKPPTHEPEGPEDGMTPILL